MVHGVIKSWGVESGNEAKGGKTRTLANNTKQEMNFYGACDIREKKKI